MPFENPDTWAAEGPLYAPGLMWSDGLYPRWKAPNRYVKAGWKTVSIKLDGRKGDGQDEARAARCRALTRELLDWYADRDPQRIRPNTWGYVIARYRSDDISPYHDVKPNTRAGYAKLLAKWQEVIGHVTVADLDYEAVKTIQRAMQDKGRSVSYIRRAFTMLRTVARYGAALRLPGTAQVAATLAAIRFQAPPPRDVAPTRAQITAIIAEADARGLHGFAAGIALQYWLALRAVDVRGQWEPAAGQGGIVVSGKRWVDGLTWDMVAPDCSSFTKVISKTRKSLTEPYTFDLSKVPELQTRLRLLANAGRIGPVIVSERTRRPYTVYSWSQTFRRLAAHLGLPDNIQMMDTRAGALTDAAESGASPVDLRNAGQHADLATTGRYLRDRSTSANNVIRLRTSR